MAIHVKILVSWYRYIRCGVNTDVGTGKKILHFELLETIEELHWI